MPTCDLSEQLCGLGAVASLEARLRDYYGLRHALCVSNATLGLLAVAWAAGCTNSEFVTTGYTYGASVAGWLLLGNRPIFADIDASTLGLEPSSVRARITSNTRAILAVDVFGYPSDTKALRDVADEHGIWYFADAAQSLGASIDNIPASSRADAFVVSFTVGKTIAAGEGGAILTDSDELYRKLVWYTQHPDRQRRELGLSLENEFGLNGRIHPLAAKLASEQFDASLKRVAARRRRYLDLARNLDEIGLTEPTGLSIEGDFEPSFFRFTAAWRTDPQPESLKKELSARGIDTSVELSPVRLLYRQAAFRTQFPAYVPSCGNCPEAERQENARFSLVRQSVGSASTRRAYPHPSGDEI